MYSNDLDTSGKSFERELMVKHLSSWIFISTEAIWGMLSVQRYANGAEIIMNIVGPICEISDLLTHFTFTYSSSSMNFTNSLMNLYSGQVLCWQKSYHWLYLHRAGNKIMLNILKTQNGQYRLPIHNWAHLFPRNART